jgi:hypothetical protein
MESIGPSAAIDKVVGPFLAEAGYARLRAGVYRAGWSTKDVEHFVYVFVVQKVGRTLKCDFGIRNRIAERFSCDAIRTYGGEPFRQFKCAEPDSCAMCFSFSGLDRSDWHIHLRDGSDGHLGLRFRAFIDGHLAPTMGQVTTLQQLLSLLAADTEHCPWWASNGAIRAAQIVALAGQIGLGTDYVRGLLESRKSLIAHGVSKTSEMRANPTAYIDQILNDWAAGHRGSIEAAR